MALMVTFVSGMQAGLFQKLSHHELCLLICARTERRHGQLRSGADLQK